MEQTQIVEQLSVLNEALKEISMGIYSLIQSIDAHAVELQRLRREIKKQQPQLGLLGEGNDG